MSEKETPDRMARFQKQSRLDKSSHGIGGRNARPQIVDNKSGPHCHLDGPASGHGAKVTSPHLGTGSDSLADAAKSIPSGSKAPKVDWSKLKGH